MTSISKEAVRRSLASGDYSLHPKSDSNSAEWWSAFDRIHDNENKLIPFVQCRRCLALLSYDPRKTGSSSLSSHVKSCRALTPTTSQNIATMFATQSTTNVSAETKRVVTEALAQMCAKDIRPFEIVKGAGFESFCQTLLDIGRKTKERIDARFLLPDPTTISRRIHSLADGKILLLGGLTGRSHMLPHIVLPLRYEQDLTTVTVKT
jgi:Hermes transposase DNA-binding domain